VEAAPSAVGRLSPSGPWVGFAPSAAGYDLVFEAGSGIHRVAATTEDLVALAVLYFEDGLTPAPDDLVTTLGDVAAAVRHAAATAREPAARAAFAEAVDAIDDGLAGDVVLERLSRILPSGLDAADHLARRVAGAAQTGGRSSEAGRSSTARGD